MAAPNMTVAALPPNVPASGDLWYNSSTGFMYLWYDDGLSAQWVVANPGRGSNIGPPGPPGPQGPAGPVGGEMASRTDNNLTIAMVNNDGEVVATNPADVDVTLPSGQALGGIVRVSDGAGTSRLLSISPANGGTINGETGALVVDVPYEVTTFRCFGGDVWSIV